MAINYGRIVYDGRAVRLPNSYPYFNDGQCVACGSRWGGDHNDQHGVEPATYCYACGTRQCMSNGLGNGQCDFCYFGLLDGWSGNGRKVCGFAHCDCQAVAVVSGKRLACAKHLFESKSAQGTKRSVLNAIGWYWPALAFFKTTANPEG